MRRKICIEVNEHNLEALASLLNKMVFDFMHVCPDAATMCRMTYHNSPLDRWWCRIRYWWVGTRLYLSVLGDSLALYILFPKNLRLEVEAGPTVSVWTMEWGGGSTSIHYSPRPPSARLKLDARADGSVLRVRVKTVPDYRVLWGPKDKDSSN